MHKYEQWRPFPACRNLVECQKAGRRSAEGWQLKGELRAVQRDRLTEGEAR